MISPRANVDLIGTAIQENRIARESVLKEQLRVDYVSTTKRKNARVNRLEGECLNLPEMLDILKQADDQKNERTSKKRKLDFKAPQNNQLLESQSTQQRLEIQTKQRKCK